MGSLCGLIDCIIGLSSEDERSQRVLTQEEIKVIMCAQEHLRLTMTRNQGWQKAASYDEQVAVSSIHLLVPVNVIDRTECNQAISQQTINMLKEYKDKLKDNTDNPYEEKPEEKGEGEGVLHEATINEVATFSCHDKLYKIVLAGERYNARTPRVGYSILGGFLGYFNTHDHSTYCEESAQSNLSSRSAAIDRIFGRITATMYVDGEEKEARAASASADLSRGPIGILQNESASVDQKIRAVVELAYAIYTESFPSNNTLNKWTESHKTVDERLNRLKIKLTNGKDCRTKQIILAIIREYKVDPYADNYFQDNFVNATDTDHTFRR